MSRSSRDTAPSDAETRSASPGYPFDEVTDEELEIYLSELEEQEESGYWNFSTLAGLALIVVGTLYLLEQVGLFEGIGISLLASMLPWFAGVLIILVGFGVLSWESSSPSSTRTRSARSRSPRDGSRSEQYENARSKSNESDDAHSAMSPDIAKAARNFVQAVRRTLTEKRLTKSRDKKISGVCGGLAEYIGLDPTLMRIAWVAATIFGVGTSVVLYVILMLIMPGPEEMAPAEKIRVTISRD